MRTSVNFKFRRAGFKIKKLMTKQDAGFEAWASFSADFPAERDWFLQGCRDIKFPMPKDLPETVTQENLLEKVQRDFNPYLFPISIAKKRLTRLLNQGGIHCLVDLATFSLRGREIMTVGLDAEEKKDVEAVLERLGLGKYVPMNYMQFLERFVCKEAGPNVWKKL